MSAVQSSQPQSLDVQRTVTNRKGTLIILGPLLTWARRFKGAQDGQIVVYLRINRDRCPATTQKERGCITVGTLTYQRLPQDTETDRLVSPVTFFCILHLNALLLSPELVLTF